MPFVERDDARVYFETTGEGPPLVLVAGIASDVASWAPIVPLLAKDFRLVMLDNRGAGRTSCEGPITCDNWVADAIAVMDRLDITQADIVGHSLGGMIALRVAQVAPDRVGKLVIAATSASPDAKSHALLREMADLYESELPAQAWFRLLFQWLFAPGFFEDEEAVTQAADLSVSYAFCQSPIDFRRQVDALDTIRDLSAEKIAARCLVVGGAHDILVPGCAETAGWEQLTDARFVEIAGAGHSLHWDKPEEFARTIAAFLDDRES